jgi:hypothetical protein
MGENMTNRARRCDSFAFVVWLGFVGSCAGSRTASPIPMEGLTEAGPDDGRAGLPKASCVSLVDHAKELCPNVGADRQFDIDRCEDLRRAFEPIGCGPALAAWVRCASIAPRSCDGGAIDGCDAERSGYLSCDSAFVARTACWRGETLDADGCEGARPYAFRCSRVPAECALSDRMRGVTCCPSFAGDAPSSFEIAPSDN